MLSTYIENDHLSETELEDLRSLLSKKILQEVPRMDEFITHFLLCNIVISIIIGIFLVSKWIFKTL